VKTTAAPIILGAIASIHLHQRSRRRATVLVLDNKLTYLWGTESPKRSVEAKIVLDV